MEENKVTKENNKMGMGILIGLLIAAVVGFGGYFIYNEFINKDTKSSSNSSSTKETNSNTEKEIKKEEKKEEVKDFDLTKFDEKKEAINGNKGWGYKLASTETGAGVDAARKFGISAKINSDKKSATMTIEWSKFFELYGLSSTDGAVRNYNITGFTSNIKEILASGYGQGAGSETILYLLEDGTVEYTPVVKSLGNNGSDPATVVKSYGKLPGVSDVVKLAVGDSYCYQENSQCVGEGFSILGIKADGSFYDLSIILMGLR